MLVGFLPAEEAEGETLSAGPCLRRRYPQEGEGGVVTHGLCDKIGRFGKSLGRAERRARRPRSRSSGERDFGDLVLVILLRIEAEQHLRAGEQAGAVEPDLRAFGIERGAAGASDRPCRPRTRPRRTDSTAGRSRRDRSDSDRRAMDAGEQIMPLEAKWASARLPWPSRSSLRQIGLLRGEEPDRAMILVAVDLRRHRLGMAVLDAVEAEHQGHVRAQRLPEPGGDVLRVGHGGILHVAGYPNGWAIAAVPQNREHSVRRSALAAMQHFIV